MSDKNQNHNPVFFLTTLSVYLGLMIVGASPQVLAQAKLAERGAPAQSFEIAAKSSSVFSQTKRKSNSKYENAQPFFLKGVSGIFKFAEKPLENSYRTKNLHREILAENDPNLLPTRFPRASI